ncbi:MAG TPA: hypothetical protein VI542_03750 [Candidatus Tectomicrobia bacterium]
MQCVSRVVAIGMVALLTGCVLQHRDLVEEQSVTLDVRHARDVAMSGVSAYQEGDHLLIAGTIWQKKARRPFSGGVQVSVLLDNGEVFEARCHEIFPKPAPWRQMRMANMYASFFNVTLPKMPPPGAVIRIVGSAEAAFCT